MGYEYSSILTPIPAARPQESGQVERPNALGGTLFLLPPLQEVGVPATPAELGLGCGGPGSNASILAVCSCGPQYLGMCVSPDGQGGPGGETLSVTRLSACPSCHLKPFPGQMW